MAGLVTKDRARTARERIDLNSIFFLLLPTHKSTIRMVAPHTLTTRVPVREARCMLALSIETIVSRWLIRMSSFSSPLRTLATQRHCGYCAAHWFNTSISCLPPPKRKIRQEGCFSVSFRTTSSIFSCGYILPAWAANGAIPIHRSDGCFTPIILVRSCKSPPSAWEDTRKFRFNRIA